MVQYGRPVGEGFTLGHGGAASPVDTQIRQLIDTSKPAIN